MKHPERVLVVCLCTKRSLDAVQWGVSFARNYGAELFVTHIVHNPFGLEGWNLPLSSAKTIEDEYTKLLEQSRKDLQDYIKTEDTEGMTIHESVIQGDRITSYNVCYTKLLRVPECQRNGSQRRGDR